MRCACPGLLLLVLALPAPARDFLIESDDQRGLIQAIEHANRLPGPDRIFLSPDGSYSFRNGWKPGEPLALPPVTDHLDLIGNRSQLRIYSEEDLSHLRIAAGVRVRLVDLNLRDAGRVALENHGELVLLDCVIEDNSAAGGAAAILNEGRLTDHASSISFNSVSGNRQLGGAIVNRGELFLNGTRLEGNQAFGDGPWSVVGSALVNLGTATLDQVSIIGNRGDDGRGGAGALANLEPGKLSIRDSLLADNEPAGLARVEQAGSIRFAESRIEP